jgi:hypothetical protein
MRVSIQRSTRVGVPSIRVNNIHKLGEIIRYIYKT